MENENRSFKSYFRKKERSDYSKFIEFMRWILTQRGIKKSEYSNTRLVNVEAIGRGRESCSMQIFIKARVSQYNCDNQNHTSYNRLHIMAKWLHTDGKCTRSQSHTLKKSASRRSQSTMATAPGLGQAPCWEFFCGLKKKDVIKLGEREGTLTLTTTLAWVPVAVARVPNEKQR